MNVETPEFGTDVCFVLIDPKHDGNVGAIARIMLNFGFTDLRVVGRDNLWSEETRKRAKNAQSVLENSAAFDTFDQAISDCSIVVGTSGKREDGKKTSMRHFLTPEELPKRLLETDGRVAIVFGPEGKGLLNDQLRECDLLVTIPSWEGYPILNLSHAVGIICYSWFTNSIEQLPRGAEDRLLDADLRKVLRMEISRLAHSFPTKDHKRMGVEEALTRVIMRGLPKDDEVHRILDVISKSADVFEKNS